MTDSDIEALTTRIRRVDIGDASSPTLGSCSQTDAEVSKEVLENISKDQPQVNIKNYIRRLINTSMEQQEQGDRLFNADPFAALLQYSIAATNIRAASWAVRYRFQFD